MLEDTPNVFIFGFAGVGGDKLFSGAPSVSPSPSHQPTTGCGECLLVGLGSDCPDTAPPGRPVCCTFTTGGLRCHPGNGKACGPGPAQESLCNADPSYNNGCPVGTICCKDSNTSEWNCCNYELTSAIATVVFLPLLLFAAL